MYKARAKQLLIDADLEINGYQLKNAIVEIVPLAANAFIDEGRFTYAQDTKLIYIGDGTTARQVGSDPSLENIDKIEFNTAYVPTGSEIDGTLYWNGDFHTLEYRDGVHTFRIGQTQYFLFYNDSVSTINAFSVLHLKSATSVGGVLYPTFELADASDWEKIQGTLIVCTKDVAPSAFGVGVRSAQSITGGDTSAIPAGSQLWLSDDGSGQITNIKPSFPSYSISIGGNYNQTAAPNGQILVNFTTTVYDTFHDGWDGAVRESFNFTVDSDGVTVTGTLENVDNSMNLTLLLSDGLYTLDTTTAPLTVTLTAGTDTNTASNYVYIPKSTKVLTVSTTGFPDNDEHCKIARLEVQSATSVQTNGGVRRNQNINDHIKKEGDNGHILHIAERVRQLNAQWESGTEATFTTPGYVSVTSGEVWQLHKQTVPSFTMPTNSILVANHYTTAYTPITNFNTINAYSGGGSWNNEWSKIVIWGVANKSGEPSFTFANLPSAGYSSEANAIADALNYTNYSIPDKYKGVGFLIGAFVIKISAGTITYNGGLAYQDLRGFFPSTAAGGGGASGVTTFLGLTDTPLAYTNNKGKYAKVNAGQTALEFSYIETMVSPQISFSYNTINEQVGGYLFDNPQNIFNKPLFLVDDINDGGDSKTYKIDRISIWTIDELGQASINPTLAVYKNGTTIMTSNVTIPLTTDPDKTTGFHTVLHTGINQSLNSFSHNDQINIYVVAGTGTSSGSTIRGYIKYRMVEV